jgi:hypothetical protein
MKAPAVRQPSPTVGTKIEEMKREQLARIGEGIITFLSKLPREPGASRNIVLERTDNPSAPLRVRLGGSDAKETFWQSVVCSGETPTDALGQAIHTYILVGEE